jgi:tetratricopeptide (TPR) repeat protein
LKQVGRIFYKVGQLSKSVSLLTDAYEMEPTDFETLLLLGATYAELTDYSQALEFLTKSYEGHPTIETLSMIGYVEALSGRKDRAQQVIKRIKVELKDHQSHPLNLARIYLAIGEKEKTYSLLETAFEQRAVDMYGLQFDPRWKLLRAEARFRELVKRVHRSPESIV